MPKPQEYERAGECKCCDPIAVAAVQRLEEPKEVPDGAGAALLDMATYVTRLEKRVRSLVQQVDLLSDAVNRAGYPKEYSWDSGPGVYGKKYMRMVYNQFAQLVEQDYDPIRWE